MKVLIDREVVDGLFTAAQDVWYAHDHRLTDAGEIERLREACFKYAALRAALDAQPGYVIVPKEPTEAMLNAPLPESPIGTRYESRRDLRPMIYRAMIAAAPTPRGDA